jgi:ubiquinone/menaquinone biosynthesis C-methylase UbiE
MLASPLRRLSQDPETILSSWVAPGMTVVEPGSGMGYFSIPLARLVGAEGRVVCVDLQPQMLSGLVRRAERSGLADRIEARLCTSGSLGADDLEGRADFVLAFAMVHEVPDTAALLGEISRLLKKGDRLLIAEPSGHVTPEDFETTVSIAERAGLALDATPRIRSSRSAVMRKG